MSVGKKSKIRDSHTSFCQITSQVRMRILTCVQIVYVFIYVYLLVFYTNAHSKGVFMCIVIVPGKTVCGQTKFSFCL